MKTATLKIILSTVTAIAVIVVGIAFATRFEKSHAPVPEGAGTSSVTQTEAPTAEPSAEPTPEATPGPETVNFDGKEYLWRDDLSTLLILGVDDQEADEEWEDVVDSQADVVVLAVLNETDHTCTLLQIDRNTMAEVPVLDENDQYKTTVVEQLCLSHDYGSTPEIRCQNTADAVSALLYDTPVDNYISFVMGGITAMNDAVGGVTVPIEDDFTGVDDTLVKGQTVTLTGEHAEKYLRARMTMVDDDSNVARMRRHRTYLNSLIGQVQAKVQEDAGFALELYSAVADYMVTDCTADELMNYAAGLADYTLTGFVTLEGDVEVHEHEEFYPDQEALMQLVIDTFYVPYEAE